MAAYYNEFKPEAAAMLRQLIRDGLIADGEVDERSITEVSSDDIKGFTQCHFFAGIGGWSIGLRLAMWDDARPVWTGSCPCQPFSSAGKQKGHGDERHLWPHWARLIRECRPPAIFGEQVASAITFGWWDDVAADLEAEGYACSAAVLPACSVGKPHKRNRLWFMANTLNGQFPKEGGRPQERIGQSGNDKTSLMGNPEHDGRHGGQERGSDGAAIQHHPQGKDGTCQPSGAGEPEYVADTLFPRLEGFSGNDSATEGRQGQTRPTAESDTLRWIACPDGKSRPVEPSIRLLAHGIQHRAPLLHAFGNAIVPQVAAEFIKASGLV